MQLDTVTGPIPPEQIVTFRDPASGAHGVIVLHSTRLGPAAGGCRLLAYPSDSDATADAMRLAEGMTLKNALAGVPFGGGKAVIREPNDRYDRSKMFEALGREVENLQGRYVTAEDVGTTVDDMTKVAAQTKHVAGLPARAGRAGGDPSPWTARGVFIAMQVAARRRLGAELSDLAVAVQGLGHVGFALCELLHHAGARLLVAEPRDAVAAEAAARFGAQVMSGPELLTTSADIFAPCALGGVLDAVSISGLRATIVCGAANNQLRDESLALRLSDHDILYAPDFLVNAGGIISGAGEYLGWEYDDVATRVELIGQRLDQTLQLAEAHNLSPHQAAKALALQRIGSKGASFPVAA